MSAAEDFDPNAWNEWLIAATEEDWQVILANRPELRDRLIKILDCAGIVDPAMYAELPPGMEITPFPPASPEVIQFKQALSRIRLRLHFMDWPSEAFWNAGTEEKPWWVPDWRYEIDLIENALHGSPLTRPEKPIDTRLRYQLPTPVNPLPEPVGMVEIAIDYFKPEGKYYSTGHIKWNVGAPPDALRSYLKALQDRGENLPGMNSHCRHYNIVIRHPAFPIMITHTA